MRATLPISQRAPSRHLRASERGQSMLEFVWAAMLALTIILGIIQIALVFNAHHMVQLAAFNAARAAIVARNADSSKPEDPTTLAEMKRKAQIAAFLTLLPVIPDLHALLPTSLGNSLGSIQNLLSLNSTDPSKGGGLASFGTRALGVLAEYMIFIQVKFVKADQDADAPDMSPADIKAMDSKRGRVEFDDRAQADNNLIKVIVSWKYPLVIPFVNAIYFAAANPDRTAALWLVSHPQYAAANPITTFEVLSGDPSVIPVWALGVDYQNMLIRLGGGGTLTDLLRRGLYRIPVKASYIMRMQWDRMP
jgi:TadE-like protein